MSLLHNDLDVFLTLCDTRSFSLAAQKLTMTQSAVTKKIQRLENSLGVDLFDRSKRPIDLTKEGVVLMRQALLARESLERTAGEIREGAFLRPEFRVGTIESLAKCFFASFHCKRQARVVTCFCHYGHIRNPYSGLAEQGYRLRFCE